MKHAWLLGLVLLAGCRSSVDLNGGRSYPCDPAAADQCPGGWRCSPEHVCFDPETPGRARACTDDSHCNAGWACGADGVCVDRNETFTLEFLAQPGTATSGLPLAPSIRVAVKGAGGAVVKTVPFEVSLALAVNGAGASLMGAGPVRTVEGVATFDQVTVDRAGTGFVLGASATGATGAKSSAFDVVSRSFTKTAFIVQPMDVVAGATWPSVQVALKDDSGNTVMGQEQPVTLLLMGGPSGASLMGTATVMTASGVASFTSLSVQQAGAGFTVVARCPGVSDVTSTPFKVTAAAPARLAFVVEPSDAVAGASLTPAPEVAIQDAFGNATTATDSIALELSMPAAGAMVAGTLAVTAVGGIARFADVHLDTAGQGFVLRATSGTLSAALSQSFSIAPGAAAGLVFTSVPASVTQGALLAPVTVSVADARGNPVPGTASISLSLVGGAAQAALGGMTTANTVAGVATFSDLSIDRHAPDFTLRAVATGLTSATSAPFAVTRLAVTSLGGGIAQVKADAGLSWTVSGTPGTLEVIAPDGGVEVVTGRSSTVVTPFATNPVGASPKSTYRVHASTTRLAQERSEVGDLMSMGGGRRRSTCGHSPRRERRAHHGRDLYWHHPLRT